MLVSSVETEAVDWLMGKNKTFDVPPPGAGLTTAMEAVLAEATSEAKIEAVSCEELTNAVVRETPFQVTKDPATNPVPFTVSVKPALPGATAVGNSGALIKGTGLDCAAPRVEATRITGGTAARNRPGSRVSAERIFIMLLLSIKICRYATNVIRSRR
jgi:hypothetical protein